jgi:hypothetical protein
MTLSNCTMGIKSAAMTEIVRRIRSKRTIGEPRYILFFSVKYHVGLLYPEHQAGVRIGSPIFRGKCCRDAMPRPPATRLPRAAICSLSSPKNRPDELRDRYRATSFERLPNERNKCRQERDDRRDEFPDSPSWPWNVWDFSTTREFPREVYGELCRRSAHGAIPPYRARSKPSALTPLRPAATRSGGPPK